MQVTTGDSWVADALAVNVGGKNYWRFNVIDSETRFVLAADLSPVRTTRAEINNNLRERRQGTFRDRDQTLRGLKQRETGQTYVDGLVTHYNFFRPHERLDGKRPAEAAGAALPFKDWEDVAAAKPA